MGWWVLGPILPFFLAMRRVSFSQRLIAPLLAAGLTSLAPVPYQPAARPAPQQTFALGTGQFLLDGRPMQLISGELHYPRIPREAWRSRLKMAKAMGLNTIGTYVF